jgi:hypothetical protein
MLKQKLHGTYTRLLNNPVADLQNRQRERNFSSFLSHRFYPPWGYGNRRYRTLSPRRREPPGVAAGRYSPRAAPTPLPCQGPGIVAPTVGSRHHHESETEPSPCRAGPCSPGATERSRAQAEGRRALTGWPRPRRGRWPCHRGVWSHAPLPLRSKVEAAPEERRFSVSPARVSALPNLLFQAGPMPEGLPHASHSRMRSWR